MNFETVNFGENGKKLLAPFKEVSYYAKSISPTEQLLFRSFELVWFKKEGEIIGYAIVGKVTKDGFTGNEDSDEIVEVMEDGKEYVYIPYFEIFDPHQNKGYGKTCINHLKEKLVGETVILYSTADSYDFWYGNGFESANYSDWWLSLTA